MHSVFAVSISLVWVEDNPWTEPEITDIGEKRPQLEKEMPKPPLDPDGCNSKLHDSSKRLNSPPRSVKIACTRCG